MNSLPSNFTFAEAFPPAGSSLPSERSELRPHGRASLKNLTLEQKRKWRAAQNAEAKRRERSRRASLGDVTITITLTAGEAAAFAARAKLQRGPIEGFARRALLLGSTFAANAGNPRGKKVKGNVAAAVICPAIADKSA